MRGEEKSEGGEGKCLKKKGEEEKKTKYRSVPDVLDLKKCIQTSVFNRRVYTLTYTYVSERVTSNIL